MQIHWPTLQRLRRGFLEGTAGAGDYWNSPRDLEQYDATFAQRIGWKWDHVLADLQALQWTPPDGTILDWGCGSGIAGRVVLNAFPPASGTTLWLSDRSPHAVQFAARRAREIHASIEVHTGVPPDVDLLLISHVLTELEPPQIEELLSLVARARSVIWVEPGTYETSLTLIAVRERLRESFRLIAPCPHQNRCGILAPGNESHWCHFFASPPPHVFTDGFWSRFGREMEIDLRSLPLSYLVLDRRSSTRDPGNATRLLGRPRLFKPYAEVLGCTGEGLCAARLTKRTHPEEYRQLKKGRCPGRVQWKLDGDQITDWRALD